LARPRIEKSAHCNAAAGGQGIANLRSIVLIPTTPRPAATKDANRKQQYTRRLGYQINHETGNARILAANA
jgi:hypothetical protein